MMNCRFVTEEGIEVPAVTAEQMREIDRIAEEEFGLTVLQMMENAGRTLALHVMEMMDNQKAPVVILAGSGGNGGGGLCCARHLLNRGYPVRIALARPTDALKGTAKAQWQVLATAGVKPIADSDIEHTLQNAAIVVDALIGYGLKGKSRGRTAHLIDLSNRFAQRVISLDIPSGLDATTGKTPGVVIRPDRVLTLALPKTGLCDAKYKIFLCDIGIPVEVYARLGILIEPVFSNRFWVELVMSRRN